MMKSMLTNTTMIMIMKSPIISIMILSLSLMCCTVVIIVYIEQEGSSSFSIPILLSSSMKKQLKNRYQSLRKDTSKNDIKQSQLSVVDESFVIHDDVNKSQHTTEFKLQDLLPLHQLLEQQQQQQQQQHRQLDVKGKEDVYMPTKFSCDAEYYRIGSPFPRWQFLSSHEDDIDDNISVPLQKSISIIDSLIHYIDEKSRYLSQFDYSLKWTNGDQFNINREYIENDPNGVRTSDHNQDWIPGILLPEVLYIVDGKTQIIWTSQYDHDLANAFGNIGLWKSKVLEKSMSTAFDLLMNNNNNDFEIEKKQIRWPRLYELLVIKNGSFPFLAHYSDYIGCNYHNWNNHTESIPLLTVAANIHCNHTFPFPSHLLYDGSKQNSNDWYKQMNEWNNTYPIWNNKISKVVFRGQLTTYLSENSTERGIRWQLTKLVHDKNQLTTEQLNLFDVKITSQYMYYTKEYINSEEIGGINENYQMNMNDFQNYKAILDVDGFSWSSRFANLLCYNSVVLKIEPNYVDYYYYPVHMNDGNNSSDNTYNQHAIMPWKHYIPIKSDLSDLIEKTAYAVDPVNEEHILSIIHNANEWCANQYTVSSINMDILDIWEKYVITLDESTELKNMYITSSSHNNDSLDHSKRSLLENENWEDQWNQIKGDVYNDNILQMVPVSY